MTVCRGCESTRVDVVLELGSVPAADFFPLADTSVAPDETAHPATMVLCADCGLAQLADDDTVTQEPVGVEPRALVDQAVAAVDEVAEAGLLRGHTVREFGSPHGGTWVPHLAVRGFVEVSDGPADVVLDSFGIMHEPDQAAAFARRADALEPGGVLLLQFHSLAAIVSQGQWNALRHGHFAYYSMPAIVRMLNVAGFSVVEVWEYPLYGGTILLAAVREPCSPSARVLDLVQRELPMTNAHVVRDLQRAVDAHISGLRAWLLSQRRNGCRTYAYGAASRAVAVFSLADVDTNTVRAVADASPGKQGRRMPGTDVPIISTDELVSEDPDAVLLMLPDLFDEVSGAMPELAGKWHLDGVHLAGTEPPFDLPPTTREEHGARGTEL